MEFFSKINIAVDDSVFTSAERYGFVGVTDKLYDLRRAPNIKAHVLTNI